MFINKDKTLSNCIIIMLKLDLKLGRNQNIEKDLKY